MNQSDAYEQIQTIDGASGSKVNFPSDSNASLAENINYVIVLMIVVLVLGIIFRLIRGSLLRATSDAVFDQQKGKEMIKNAGKILIFFILTYSVLSWINPELTYWSVVIDRINTSTRAPAVGLNASCPTNPYNGSTNIREMLKIDEGNRLSSDNDTTGNSTIGIGFNLNRANAESSLRSAGVTASLSDLKSGRVSLTQDQVDKLFENDFVSHRNDAVLYAKKYGKDFNTLPQNIQNVLINMTFNMGSLDSFTKMGEALKNNDYSEMARQIISSTYCVQVPNRCYRLASLADGGKCGAVRVSQGNKCADIANSDLVEIAPGITLKKDAAENFKKMQADAAKAGITITPTSGYRSDSKQQEIWNGSNCTDSSCAGKVGKPCSLGGVGSNHQTGTAIDIRNGCVRGQICSCNDPVCKWMEANGSKYGFINNLPLDRIHYSPTGK